MQRVSKASFSRQFGLCAVAIFLLLATGCTLGPQQIDSGRLRYNEAVQRTFQEEMLLNLVRLKYRESPEFLSVGAIAAQYSFDGSAGTGLTLPDGGTKVLGLNGAVARTEKPTISYMPARGEEFQKGLLAPIDLESLELLSRTGWSWERILRTTVQYMNDVDNATSAGGPTPEIKPDFEEFRYLAQQLRQLQIQRRIELASAEREGPAKRVPLEKNQLDGDSVIGALRDGYHFNDSADGIVMAKNEQYVALIVHPEAKYSREMQEVARLLGLLVDEDPSSPAVFEVAAAKEGRIRAAFKNRKPQVSTPSVWEQQDGLQRLPPPLEPPQGRDDIVVSTRSLLEVMFYLSQGIQVPEPHRAEGLVTSTFDRDGSLFDWSELTGDLLNVQSCEHRPKNAAVAIKFKGHWFYIDDRDLNSQSTFMLLVELFEIEVRAGGGGGFLYTLSVGG